MSAAAGRAGRQRVDLFDDPPWPATLPVDEPAARSPRPFLLASLAVLALFLASMALPWLGVTWTPGRPPLTPWLDRGVLPGSRAWGILMVALAGAAIVGIVVAWVTRRRAWTLASLLAGTGLVLATVLETLARVPLGDGPGLRAVDGAWVGLAAAVLAWIGVAAASALAVRAWRTVPEPPPG